MEQLPVDVLIHGICRYLSVKEVNRLIRVNRHLAGLSTSTSLWKYMYNRDLSILQTPLCYRQAYRDFIKSLRGGSEWWINPMICKHGCDRIILGQTSILNSHGYFIIVSLAKYEQFKLIDVILETRGNPSFPGYLWDGITSSNHVHLLTRYADVISDYISNRRFQNEALERATAQGYKDMAEAMISRGADGLNRALTLAVKYGYVDLVKLLLSAGATNYQEELLSACRHNHIDILLLLKQYYWNDDTAERLVNQAIGAYPVVSWDLIAFLLQFPMKSYDTLLSYAVRYQRVALVKKLVELGADPSPYRSSSENYLPYSDMEYLLSPEIQISRYLASLQ